MMAKTTMESVEGVYSNAEETMMSLSTKIDEMNNAMEVNGALDNHHRFVYPGEGHRDD